VDVAQEKRLPLKLAVHSQRLFLNLLSESGRSQVSTEFLRPVHCDFGSVCWQDVGLVDQSEPALFSKKSKWRMTQRDRVFALERERLGT